MARHNFRRLNIWKESLELSKEIYAITENFPKSETYALSSQIQRAVVSIPSNIAEGTAKGSDKHFIQYLETALGSAFEVETQLIIAHEVGYIKDLRFEELEILIQKLQGMITRFIESLKQS